MTRVAALPHRGQQRAASKARSVITSTRVCPSGVSVTAVTSSPRIPSRTVAAAQVGAGCAGPAEPVPSNGGGSFCGFAFLGRNENPGGTAFCLPAAVIHRRIRGYVDRVRVIPRPGARGNRKAA